VALVTDARTLRLLPLTLAAAIKGVGGDYAILEVPIRALSDNNELRGMIGRALEEADCLIGLTMSPARPHIPTS
jgi:hypothetical protein